MNSLENSNNAAIILPKCNIDIYWNECNEKIEKPDKTGNKNGRKKFKKSFEKEALKILWLGQAIKTKQNFQNNKIKFNGQVHGKYTKENKQPDAEETEQFWNKIWEKKEENIKTYDEYSARIKITWGRLRGKHIPCLTKNGTQENTELEKKPSIHERLALQISKCLEEASIPVWMTNRETTLIQKYAIREPFPEIIVQ